MSECEVTTMSSKKGQHSVSSDNPIVVLNLKNKVQMAKPLYIQLLNANLSLPELKLIDVYLSAINSHKPENRVIQFSKGELEKLFGVKRIQKEALEGYFDTLLKTVVLITGEEENSEKQTIRKASETLFKTAVLEQDKKDGLWKVTMECGEASAELIFNIDKKGYLQHSIASTSKLQSLSSFLLLKFLENRRNNKGKYPQIFEVTLDELREQLNLTGKYPAYKEFNRCVLAAGQKEIHSKTEVRFEYEPVRQGRMVRAIRFTLLPRVNDESQLETEREADTAEEILIQETEQAESSADEYIPEDTVKTAKVEVAVPGKNVRRERQHYYYNNEMDKKRRESGIENKGAVSAEHDEEIQETISFLAAACCNEFSPEQMEFLYYFVSKYVKDEIQQFELLRQAYVAMDKQDQDGKIENRFAYFKTVLANSISNIAPPLDSAPPTVR